MGAALRAAAVAGALAAGGAADALAQAATTMPSTLRYGSGLFDVPVATVLPHLTVTGTYSGFRVSVDRSVVTDGSGRPTGFGEPSRRWMSDGSVAVGILNFVELGATFQSFGGSASGGTVAGGFGRLRLLTPRMFPFGVALGFRLLSAPAFDTLPGEVEAQPTRLGGSDPRFRKSYEPPGPTGIETGFSPYVVATADLAGPDVRFLPEHDFTLTFGRGGGLFDAGDDLPVYAGSSGDGWFGGAGLHVKAGSGSLLHLLAEYNGFDLNLGAQMDHRGMRVGAFVLGANHEEFSEFRSPKLGVLASVSFCPVRRGLCGPKTLDRPPPRIVRVPAPPPDTVTVVREVSPPLPTGVPARICLATGENVRILLTEEGDTLVGPRRIPVRELRPALDFAGTYAEGRGWFEAADGEVLVDGARFRKVGEPELLSCGRIVRVGDFRGVPVFAHRGAEPPYGSVVVPVRPGWWQAYARDGRPRE